MCDKQRLLVVELSWLLSCINLFDKLRIRSTRNALFFFPVMKYHLKTEDKSIAFGSIVWPNWFKNFTWHCFTNDQNQSPTPYFEHPVSHINSPSTYSPLGIYLERALFTWTLIFHWWLELLNKSAILTTSVERYWSHLVRCKYIFNWIKRGGVNPW